MKNDINENDLDGLLRDLYLERHSEAADEAQADFVLAQDYPAVPDPAKEKALLKRLAKPRGFSGRTLYLLLAGLLILVIALCLYLFSGPHPAGPPKAVPYGRHEGRAMQPDEARPGKTNLPSQEAPKERDTFGHPKALAPVNIHDTVGAMLPARMVQPPVGADEPLPYLTKKDELRYTKVKEQMLMKLLAPDKGLYTRVPANKFFYAGKTVTTDAFTIRNMGVTNLEYKTFLADLLVQKRDEDYATARVRNEGWSRDQAPGFAGSYFSDEAYNDFPVVNITIGGAKLFCRWLEEESTLYITRHHLKMKPLQARLPYDEEWICAAREGYAKIAYENGYNTIYDLNEGLVDRSFVNRAELVKKRVKRVDTLYAFFTTNHFGWNEAELSAFFQKTFKYYPSAPADTIYTDRMKVYGKIGRVSELVCQRNGARTWLPGLSWKSKEQYLALDAEFKTHGSSPFVGFRPVIVHVNDPEYSNPFW